MHSVTSNGRQYRWPAQPVVVVCLDGCEPDYLGSDGGGYLERAISNGRMPYLEQIRRTATFETADSIIPSFTNPNNLSIVTGVPPSVHGISGNFFYDVERDREIMMNDPVLLRTSTIFRAFQQKGANIAIVTAKDKLRRLLGHQLDFGQGGAVCFSAEQCSSTTLEENGIDNAFEKVALPVPDVYSGALSEYVFAAGLKLLRDTYPDIIYLSTSDYIQHKHAPGSSVADDFCAMIDGYLQQMHDSGAVIALTADHGMKAKHNVEGQPNIVYLEPLLQGRYNGRIILPITDPYVVHHGALGGFATLYLDDPGIAEHVIDILSTTPGIELALSRRDACRQFELPADRVGDIVVIACDHWVLGHSADYHDLATLKEPLRSHGGLSEQRVPFIVSQPLYGLSLDRLHNYDIFDAVLNHTG
jgi:phosphonoacetate hydrolase